MLNTSIHQDLCGKIHKFIPAKLQHGERDIANIKFNSHSRDEFFDYYTGCNTFKMSIN